MEVQAFLRGKHWDVMMHSDHEIDPQGPAESGEIALDGGFLMASDERMTLEAADFLFEAAVAAFIPMHPH